MPEKLIFLIQRSTELSRPEFCRRFLEEHAPLVLQHCSGLRRYVVNLHEGREEGGAGGAAPSMETYDAATELWFDSLEAFTARERRYDTAAGAAIVQESAAALIGAAAGYHVAETVQRDYERSWSEGERSLGKKMLSPLRRKDGLSRDAFVEHWRGEHAALALKHVLGIGRYVNNVVLAPLTPNAPEFDGIVEVHYLEQRRFDSPEGEAALAADVQQFLSPPPRNFVGEYVLRG